jgi:C-terminal processing protease CtpA/Prc
MVAIKSGLAILLFVLSWPLTTQEITIINEDEGGPVIITGEVSYTNPFFTTGVAEPLIILEDQAGFIDRNEYFLMPQESQTIGQITSDFYTSPFSYSLSLPIEPRGSLRDVDNDGIESAGVMVFAVAYWKNTWGDPFLEERDLFGGGWSTAYASTRTSTHPDALREIIGGRLLVYAPDDKQRFPVSFGEDGLLFTADDPVAQIPRGYTTVNLDTDPFTFDRSRRQTIDLNEPGQVALVDFSDLSFTDAFDQMVEKFRTEYAFTEYKNLDWDALHTEFHPRFEEAERRRSDDLYYNALREFLWRIPDGHVSLRPFTPFVQRFQFDVARGIGIAIHETDNGQALVTYLVEDSPAQRTGLKLGTEIIAVDDIPITDYIGQQQPWTQPFSTPHNLRLEQQRYATRFPADDTSVVITYRNPGESDTTTVTLPTIGEVESFNNTSISGNLTGFELPVEFEILPSGYAYVSIYSFFDNSLLTIQLWERMIDQIKEAGVSRIIIDMRQNGGGFGFLADQMAAYFFDEEQVVGQRGRYNEDLGDFLFDERGQQRLYPPRDELQYDGSVAVLVGPSCASACERFAYNMTIDDRAEIVGFYPTAGLGGGVNDFLMPRGMTIRFTVTRSVDNDGNIHIEGQGVTPTIRVPINEETLFSAGDPVLEYAIDSLDGR